MKRLLMASVIAMASMVAMTTQVAAAPLTGSIGYAGTASDVGDGFDNIDQLTITDVAVLTASGDLDGIVAFLDLLNHVNPLVYDPPTAYGPLWTHVDSGLEFHLTSMSVDTRESLELDLTGAGFFRLAGWDDTPALWAFSAQRADDGVISTTFSADAITQQVPEPAMLTLLGLGLAVAGRSVARRRRLA